VTKIKMEAFKRMNIDYEIPSIFSLTRNRVFA
jgi:hypothetical protein